jgi:succinate dehydrogenase flavin-adding protein (antitoxin of CptAB toxin-antitoxin module)
MTPFMLRQLWSLIESTQANWLLALDDASLVQWITKQYKQQRALNRDEMSVLNSYVSAKTPLIRALAQQRLAGGQL